MDHDTDAREFYQERAAITEYDGGLRRYDAEFYACVAVWRYCHRTNAAPPTLGYYRVLERHFTTETPREPGEKNA
jgi:hypothetical protein